MTGLPDGPVVQSLRIGFRTLYLATLLLALGWTASNCRQVPPDSQIVVRRFGQIVRVQPAGLLLAWPRPIEQVDLLAGGRPPDRADGGAAGRRRRGRGRHLPDRRRWGSLAWRDAD